MKGEKISWWRTQFTEEDIKKISETIRNENMSMGVVTQEFEEQLAHKLDVPYVVATTSGSTALLMALIASDITKGDEVIIPNRTWIAAVHAVLLIGAIPILIDVENDKPLIDIQKINQAITKKTRAIIPTQLNGRAINMKKIWSIAEENNLVVIEDSAQALLSVYMDKFMGTQSDFGCFSLSVAKLLSTGQGGFIVTNDKNRYEKLISIRTHGISNFTQFSPFSTFGFNFRITDVTASIGLVRLKYVEEKVKALIEIYKLYEVGLKNFTNIELVPVNTNEKEIPLYIEVLVKNREEVVRSLNSKNIEARYMYPNLDTAKYFSSKGGFPNSERFEKNGLVLPCGPDQPKSKVLRTIDALSIFNSK